MASTPETTKQYVIEVTDPKGLHVRPMTALSLIAGFLATKTITSTIADVRGHVVSMQSRLGIIKLPVLQGDSVIITLTGDGELLEQIDRDGVVLDLDEPFAGGFRQRLQFTINENPDNRW